jgi:hypothetical protein
MFIYSTLPICSIAVEGDHRTLNLEGVKCNGPIKGATMCSRIRKPNTLRLLERNDFQNYLITNWYKKGLFVQLLGHRFEAKHINSMTFARKSAHIYGYHIDDQWALDVDLRGKPSDAPGEDGLALAVPAPAGPMDACQNVCSEWLKTLSSFEAKADPVKQEATELMKVFPNDVCAAGGVQRASSAV